MNKNILLAASVALASLVAANSAHAQGIPVYADKSANEVRLEQNMQSTNPETRRAASIEYSQQYAGRSYRGGYIVNGGGYYDPYYPNETSAGRTKRERDPGSRYQYCRGSGWATTIGNACPGTGLEDGRFMITDTRYPDGRVVRTYTPIRQ